MICRPFTLFNGLYIQSNMPIGTSCPNINGALIIVYVWWVTLQVSGWALHLLASLLTHCPKSQGKLTLCGRLARLVSCLYPSAQATSDSWHHHHFIPIKSCHHQVDLGGYRSAYSTQIGNFVVTLCTRNTRINQIIWVYISSSVNG